MTVGAEQSQIRCIAFDGTTCIASGDIESVALKTKSVMDLGTSSAILIFNDLTSDLVEIDFRGTAEDVLRRLAGQTGTAHGDAPQVPRGPGRPKLGVVAREVTLLPRHWDWLSSQPGGASVVLRRLVEEAKRANAGKDRVRRSQGAAYKFMSAMAGNEPGFEEAARALFAGNLERFSELVERWPVDVRDHARKLALGAFPGSGVHAQRL
jgi:uncharacterized protein